MTRVIDLSNVVPTKNQEGFRKEAFFCFFLLKGIKCDIIPISNKKLGGIMKQKISLLVILSALTGCIEGNSIGLASFMKGVDDSQSVNGNDDKVRLSDVVGSLSVDQANSMYNGGDSKNSSGLSIYDDANLASYNGNDTQYYPKYLSFSDSGDGVVATTQMDYYDYSSDTTSSTPLTSTSVSKNKDGSINIVLQDENKQKKLNVLLGANQLKDFNKTGSYMDYGVWSLDGNFPVYAVLYGNGDSNVINNSYQKSTIPVGESVEFNGKTKAVKIDSANNKQSLSGDVTLNFGFSDAYNGVSKEPKTNVNILFNDGKNIAFEQYGDSNDIYNIKVNNESVQRGDSSMLMEFNPVDTKTAPVGNNNADATVNVYDRVIGVYNLQNIPENGETVEIIGGFAAKAKDEDNYFTITPDNYTY